MENKTHVQLTLHVLFRLLQQIVACETNRCQPRSLSPSTPRSPTGQGLPWMGCRCLSTRSS